MCILEYRQEESSTLKLAKQIKLLKDKLPPATCLAFDNGNVVKFNPRYQENIASSQFTLMTTIILTVILVSFHNSDRVIHHIQ